MMKKIDHPNLVKFIETCKTTSNYYIFMKYCSEGDLKMFIEKFNNQPQYETHGLKNRHKESDARYVIREVGKGLSYLSKNLIMHRDIKGANIFLKSVDPKQPDKIVLKLGDFGCSVKFKDPIGPTNSKAAQATGFVGTIGEI